MVFKDRKFFVDKVRVASRVQQGTNGEVMRADNVLEIQANDTILEVLEARNEQKRRVPVKDLIEDYAIKQGIYFNMEKP